MATNPDQVLGPSAEQLAADQARAANQARATSALRDQMVSEMRAAYATRRATVDQIQEIAAKYGQRVLADTVQATIDWAKNPDADVNLITFSTGATLTPTPDAGAGTVEAAAPLDAQQQAVLSDINRRERLGLQSEFGAAGQAVSDYYRNEPVGADPQTVEFLNRMGWGYLTPLVTAARVPLEALEAGTAGGLAFAGQNLANLVNPLTGSRTISAEDVARQGMGMLEGEFFRSPGGYGLPIATPRAAPASPGRMATALERAEPIPSAVYTPEQRAISQILTRQPIEQVAARAPTLPEAVAAAPRTVTPPRAAAAAAAPEIPPVPPRAAAAAPEAPPVSPAAAAEERIAAIDSIEPGTAPYLATPESRASAMQTLVDIGEVQPIISQGLNKRFSGFAADYLNAANLSRPQDIPFTEFFRQHISAETLPLEQVQALARKHNLEELDIVEATTGYRVSANEWGRIGQTLSMASRLVPTEMGDLARAMGSAPPPSLWRRLGNTQRGLLVSQLATTMRNNLSSVVRAGIDVATGAADTAINTALNPIRRAAGREAVAVDPFNAFRMITQQFDPAQNRNIYNQLRNANAKINKELMTTYNADIYRTTQRDKFSRVENAVEVLNTFNRVSEQYTRKAVFPVYLRRAYNRDGGVVVNGRRASFDELANGNQLHLIPEDTFRRALNDTLDFTYSRQPKRGSVADNVIQALDKLGPVGATLVPFPRFMLNAARFQYEYSPASLLQVIASPKQWRAIAAGDTDLLNKALIGSVLLYGAYEFQNSEYAGSKWYMARTPDGNEVDLRPYFPTPFYLFLADVIKRQQDGTLDQAYTGADIVQGLTGAQFRAGAGFYAIDQALKDISGSGGKSIPERASTVMGQILANTGSAWLTPFGQFKDFVAEFDTGEAVRRESEESLAGTLLRPVPFAQQALGLPEQTYTTREGGLETQHPFLRQLLGATITPTNRLELELRQLGIIPSDLYSREGIPGIDRRQRELIGLIASRNADQVLFTPEYEAASKIDQTDMLQEFYKEVRAAAREVLRAENPAVDMIIRFQDLDRENKIRVNEQYQEVHGQTFLQYMGDLSGQLMEAPIVTTQEEYDALPVGAQFTDPGDMKVYTKE